LRDVPIGVTDTELLEHTFVAITRDRGFLVVWCACGWMSKAGSMADCFDFHGFHVSHVGR
jgi:hypothetical protein